MHALRKYGGTPTAVAVMAGVAIVAAAVAGGAAERAGSQETFAKPAAPASVTAKLVRGKLEVSWKAPATASPAITHYVVSDHLRSSRKGTCPVTVSSTRRKAQLPILPGRTRVWPAVRAVNSYGFSTEAITTGPVQVKAPRRSDFRNVQVLQFSDFHGAIEESDNNAGAAKLATAFASDRTHSPATFTAASGDSLGGAPIIASYFEEIPTVRVQNKMGLDVSTFGNHEHDRPLTHLKEMIGRSNFAWTDSNYSTLQPLQTPKRKVKPYVIVERGGVKVGFVGMNTEDTKELVKPGNLGYGTAGKEIVISRKVDGVNAQIRAVKKAGAEVVVALTHQGWNLNANGVPTGRLIEVAGQIKGAAAVYGGHTHQTYASIIGGNPTVEVRNSGQEYTRLQLCLNTRTDRVVGSNVEYVLKDEIAKLAADPKVAAVVSEYQKKIGPIFDQKVGVVAGIFPRGTSGGHPKPVERTGETQLGNLTADRLKLKYGTDLVFTNGGGIRDTLPANGYTPSDPTLRRPGPGTTGPYDVVLGDIKSIYPFGTEAATSTMTGEQLWGALEVGVSAYPSGAFPQISGFKFTFDLGRRVGSRVTEVAQPDGTPIPKDGTSYTVTTLSFMAFGGDGYGTFFNPSQVQVREPYDEALTDALKADLAAGITTPVAPLDGRITCLGAECVPR
ncbi:MAG: 5'-nucleotidase C-terminal domain-containing protein [Solirubrobacterales bacterium]